MSKTYVVFGDAHAQPQHPNDRADWLGHLINDVRPDVVVDLGDTADLNSLCSYDKGTRAAIGRNYNADIESHRDFQDRVWHPIKKSKRKLPRRVRLIGNHEQRIEKALDIQPELVGTIGFADLDLGRYDDVIAYRGNTPGSIELDGITFSHYFVSGVMGRPIGGEHQAYGLLSKYHSSCVQGHSHIFDYSVRTNGTRKIHGLVAGCFMDREATWAGQSNKFWWRGCFILRNVEQGQYDLEAISVDQLAREYQP